MPMIWDAAAEAKLMAAIFSVCDVKVAGPQLKQLADLMGNDCTPKAITHRLSKLRKAGGGAEGNKSDTGEPKAKKLKTTPVAAVKKNGGRKKRAATPVPDSDDEEAATQLTPPTTVDRPQRTSRGIKRSYDETSIVKEEEVDDEDDDVHSGRVVIGKDGLPKGYDGIDVGEDIGQGLRAGKVDLTGEEESGSELSEDGIDDDGEDDDDCEEGQV